MAIVGRRRQPAVAVAAGAELSCLITPKLRQFAASFVPACPACHEPPRIDGHYNRIISILEYSIIDLEHCHCAYIREDSFSRF